MEIVYKLNWVDVLVVIIMIRICYVAFMDGLSHEMFPLIGSVIVLITSLRYYQTFGSAISQNLFGFSPEVANFLSFTIIIIGMGFIVRVLKGLLDKIVQVSWHPILEKFGGLVLGIAKGAIVTSLVLIMLALLPLPYLQWSIRERSLTGMSFLRIGPVIYSKTAGLFPTIRIGSVGVDRDTMVNDIVKDKAIPIKAKGEKPVSPE